MPSPPPPSFRNTPSFAYSLRPSLREIPAAFDSSATMIGQKGSKICLAIAAVTFLSLNTQDACRCLRRTLHVDLLVMTNASIKSPLGWNLNTCVFFDSRNIGLGFCRISPCFYLEYLAEKEWLGLYEDSPSETRQR